MASVRFICGTQELHRQLESAVARFLGKGDAILYSSCWDANGGIFETILGEEDAVLSDALNHASIIDGVRLCKSRRFRYDHSDMANLEKSLQEAKDCRLRLVVTDGVFSMDGDLAKLPAICALADKYDAAVMVDDSHATGILGPWRPRAPPNSSGVQDRIDIFTSTLGKTLAGARRRVHLRSAPRSWTICVGDRDPYLFSNALLSSHRHGRCEGGWNWCNSRAICAIGCTPTPGRMRTGLESAGFTIRPGNHPILPLMIGDAALATAPWRTGCQRRESTWSASAIQWCRKVRRASASRCRQDTTRSRSTEPSRRSPRRGGEVGVTRVRSVWWR